MISRIDMSETPAFKAGYLNILATADNHGKITALPKVMQCIKNNASEIFPKSGNKSTLNLFAIVGDWFINPSKKGFITNPEITNGELQKWALIKAIDYIRETIRRNTENVAGGLKLNFSTVYAMGNHCLDAGTDFILNVMKTCPMKSLITNVNMEKSDKIAEAASNSENILKSVEFTIPDDKKPDLQHKVLVLGVTIPSMDYYNPGLCNGLEFYDNSNQKDTALTEEKLQGTINSVKEQVEKFKKNNPKGAVILLSHMGESLAEIIIKNVPEINHVLNGHDHKTTQKRVGNTIISSLGKDNEIFKSLICKFDDEGNFLTTIINQFDIGRTMLDGIDELPFQKSLNKKLENDRTPLIKMSGVEELYFGDEIRFQNSYLMNFLTTTVKKGLVERMGGEDFVVGLQSSSIRGGIKNGSDNLAIMKIFDGVSIDLSGLEAGCVKGKDLAGLIVENISDNLLNPTRNTLIHWSDIQVDKSLIKAIKNGMSDAQYQEAVRIRNPITDELELIDLTKEYKMVIGSKYLNKDSIVYPPKIRGNFTKLNTTYEQVFRKYLEENDFVINITHDIKESRVL